MVFLHSFEKYIFSVNRVTRIWRQEVENAEKQTSTCASLLLVLTLSAGLLAGCGERALTVLEDEQVPLPQGAVVTGSEVKLLSSAAELTVEAAALAEAPAATTARMFSS